MSSPCVRAVNTMSLRAGLVSLSISCPPVSDTEDGQSQKQAESAVRRAGHSVR